MFFMCSTSRAGDGGRLIGQVNNLSTRLRGCFLERKNKSTNKKAGSFDPAI
jgi:hypothetical protein